MRADPKLLTGLNRLWIKFFLLSVYATMYVRDHARPAFHAALGVDPTEYDYKVFRVCSEITRQVFPLVVDIDHPQSKAAFDRLFRITQKMETAGTVGKIGLGLQAAAAFLSLYSVPSIANEMPTDVRLAPVW